MSTFIIPIQKHLMWYFCIFFSDYHTKKKPQRKVKYKLDRVDRYGKEKKKSFIKWNGKTYEKYMNKRKLITPFSHNPYHTRYS